MEEQQCYMTWFRLSMKATTESHLPLKMGKKGVVDFSEYILKSGVFEHFKDVDFFKDLLLASGIAKGAIS